MPARMPEPSPQPREYRNPETKSDDRLVDRAYIAPMATFLIIIFVSTYLPKSAYPWMYVARAFVVGAMLVFFWKYYTKIRWNFWWLGAIVGVIGIFQWVGMQLFLQKHFEMFRPSPGSFNPFEYFTDPTSRWAWIVIRVLSATIVVPIMEELFWRDYLWRQTIAPNDFRLASVGEFDWKPFLGIAVVFAFVHGNWGLTAVAWALMIHVLLVYTKSLGACIVAHGVTNLLLAVYVLKTQDWSFW
jgi:CAAX prenyl protease-like protein